MGKSEFLKGLLKDAKKDKGKWLKDALQAENDERWMELSFLIALEVLEYLKLEGVSQKELAQRMNCSPQYLSKVLKGKENLTLETICKLETATGVKLIGIPLNEDLNNDQVYFSSSRLSYSELEGEVIGSFHSDFVADGLGGISTKTMVQEHSVEVLPANGKENCNNSAKEDVEQKAGNERYAVAA